MGSPTIWRVCLIDETTSKVIVDKIYKWKEVPAAKRVGGLVNSFFQLSREAETSSGNFIRAKFEVPSAPVQRKRLISMFGRKNSPPDIVLSLHAYKFHDLIAACFFEGPSGDDWKDRISSCLKSIAVSFSEKGLGDVVKEVVRNSDLSATAETDFGELGVEEAFSEEDHGFSEHFCDFQEEMATLVNDSFDIDGIVLVDESS